MSYFNARPDHLSYEFSQLRIPSVKWSYIVFFEGKSKCTESWLCLRLPTLPCIVVRRLTIFLILYFLLWPTNAQLFHITPLHVSTLSCHPQGACNQYLTNLHKYFKCSCW